MFAWYVFLVGSSKCGSGVRIGWNFDFLFFLAFIRPCTIRNVYDGRLAEKAGSTINVCAVLRLLATNECALIGIVSEYTNNSRSLSGYSNWSPMNNLVIFLFSKFKGLNNNNDTIRTTTNHWR